MYLWANLAIACALLYTLAYACVFSTAFSDGATVCTGKPLLQRHCFLATTIALLATLFAILCDRVRPVLGDRDLGALRVARPARPAAVDRGHRDRVDVRRRRRLRRARGGRRRARARALAAVDERAAYCAVAGHKC